MRVPVSWLREYVEFDWPVEELARRLVFTSCEVDRIVRIGVPDTDGNLEHFLVGKVVEADKHPNADKLQLTKVDVGEAEPRSIVCGAWNFGAGATVAVVVPGGVMPGGEFTIERRKLRGEVSDGMILSERELELGQDHGGIMLLADELEAGTPLADVLPLGDDVLEIETLYNRPDLTSIYGIAREVSVLTGSELRSMPGIEPARGDEAVDIRVEDLDGCPRYIGRLFRDVLIRESPAWLKSRLVGAGMRPISNVVDITNYVMLALGSPLHAFDYDSLAGGRIIVRRARSGEALETLDGTERALDAEDLVIADGERPVAIAGVMGGANTEVSDATATVLLEAANFEPLTVLRSGERHRMRTESQTRWEKGVDPELAGPAATYASQLLVELAGARLVGEGEVRGAIPAPPVIAFRPAYTNQVLGLEISEDEQRDRLGRLGFAVSGDWQVQTPSWRARDVRRDIDVVEEVARFRLEDVPATLPVRQAMFGRLTHEQRLRRQVEDVLVGAGYYEAYTYSLQPSDPDPRAIELPVPLSQQQRVLRTTLAVGLLGAARHNVDSGNRDISLFEVAHVYLPTGTSVPEERWHLGGILRGDFFTAKGAVEAICGALHVEPVFERAQPLAEATIGAILQFGWVAQYGPLDVEGEWSAFELDLEQLFAAVPERVLYRDVITYPPLREDYAFVVDESVPAGELIAAVRAAGGEEVREVRFLSDYRGAPIPDGKKSVAVTVSFQSAERTLTDDDGERLRKAIAGALAEHFGATLRI